MRVHELALCACVVPVCVCVCMFERVYVCVCDDCDWLLLLLRENKENFKKERRKNAFETHFLTVFKQSVSPAG